MSYGVTKQGHSLRIHLTEKETKICNLLKNVTTFIHSQRPELPLIHSRIAGGWVRDKLLGKECHDLDVAINDMMGFEYATYVNQYLQTQGIEVRNIAKIDSNPEKSKHLETATTRLFNQEVDFCNLRTEIYEKGSRIPTQITFGTPEEDAYRRDTTINSMFYNVNTNQVEDYTQKGIPDLIEGLIRTPLPPFETFHDDPLRVIRCIRFASRLNFTLVTPLIEAAKHPDIKNALVHKISRERIGIEFEKMITGPHPLLSLQLIKELDLYSVMMTAPENIKGEVGSEDIAVKAVGILMDLITKKKMEATKEEKRSLVLGASVLPFYGVTCETKKKVVPAVQQVLRDALKTNNADVNTISTLFRGLSPVKEMAHKNLTEPVSRSELGMLIRDLGSLWQTTLKLSITKDILEGSDIDETCTTYNLLQKAATDYGITECYLWKHIVDGKRAAQIVGQKPGPIVTQLLKIQMMWQLENPTGSVEDCEQAIKTYWDNK